MGSSGVKFFFFFFCSVISLMKGSCKKKIKNSSFSFFRHPSSHGQFNEVRVFFLYSKKKKIFISLKRRSRGYGRVYHLPWPVVKKQTTELRPKRKKKETTTWAFFFHALLCCGRERGSVVLEREKITFGFNLITDLGDWTGRNK